MMDRMIKVFYVLVIAMVVFLGGLLISQGMNELPQAVKVQQVIAPRR